MIFDLLTLPQDHQFDPRMKLLLAFCSARHPRRLNMPLDHVWKKWFDPLGTPSAPRSHPWGMTQATEWKSRLICFVSFICESTHKVWYKNLWNWHGNRNLMIFDLWPHPKVTSLILGYKFYLHSVLLVILVDLISHMTMFEKNDPWAPQRPKVIKIFEIDFVIEIKWYLTFWPLPRASGGAPFMRVTHTPNLVELRPMV